LRLGDDIPDGVGEAMDARGGGDGSRDVRRGHAQDFTPRERAQNLHDQSDTSESGYAHPTRFQAHSHRKDSPISDNTNGINILAKWQPD
jgi:hypothetical protein